jgi:predicted AlkP superfamily phosphohydrolase/phosphomutase
MAKRVLVIGLDCAAPQFVFDRWLPELPTIRSLTERGSFGVLRSCDPPITVPAWSVMTSSRSPGSLGFYGFRNRRDHSYDQLVFADSRSVRAPRVWDILSTKERDVIVLGVPQTYPPSRVHGEMVSCFLTPDTRTSRYTYPPELKDEIEQLVGHYMVDVENFRTEDKDRLLDQIEEMTEKRFRLAEHLLETRPWDLFFMVEMGTDRIHHGFWRFTDSEHRLFEPGNPYEHAMLDYYRRLDSKIAGLLRFADDETAVLVVSDHGAKRMDGGICVNEWLRREGYLVLREEPTEPTRLTPDLIDWSRTVAWGEGGYYCRLFLNVEGRESEGIVAAGDFERVRDELKQKLEALGDDEGRPIGTVAHRPEELYAQANGIAPDLLVYFGDLYWRSVGQVGTGTVHVFARTTRTMPMKGCTCSSPTTSRRGQGRSVLCTTSRRRCSNSSASRCRPTWKGRACFRQTASDAAAGARPVGLSRRLREGHAHFSAVGSKVGGGAGRPQGQPPSEFRPYTPARVRAGYVAVGTRPRVGHAAVPHGPRPVRAGASLRGRFGDGRRTAQLPGARGHRQRPAPPRRRLGRDLPRLPRAALDGARADQGRHALRPRGLARRVRRPRDLDDVEVRALAAPVRRREGRDPLRQPRALTA